MDKTRVLVVDDDVAISKLLCTNLKARGYEVSLANDGNAALEAIESNFTDLIVLDIMMPGLDGVEVCRRVREWSRVPIIMLSARGDEKDKVKCLELGADDYLTKPFGIAELMARINTALRHSEASMAAPAPTNFKSGDLEINFASRRVTMAGREVKLTPTEYSLLQHLVTNPNKVLTHSMLLQKVWGEQYSMEKEYLRVFIGRLRKRLEPNPVEPRYIITVPGVGYHFNHEDLAD
ncbi:MAG: response regulator transcription factor [Dehalococcoidales bacterium]|jgi:two-component system KDP operon response regulator KdpE